MRPTRHALTSRLEMREGPLRTSRRRNAGGLTVSLATLDRTRSTAVGIRARHRPARGGAPRPQRDAFRELQPLAVLYGVSVLLAAGVGLGLVVGSVGRGLTFVGVVWTCLCAASIVKRRYLGAPLYPWDLLRLREVLGIWAQMPDRLRAALVFAMASSTAALAACAVSFVRLRPDPAGRLRRGMAGVAILAAVLLPFHPSCDRGFPAPATRSRSRCASATSAGGRRRTIRSTVSPRASSSASTRSRSRDRPKRRGRCPRIAIRRRRRRAADGAGDRRGGAAAAVGPVGDHPDATAGDRRNETAARPPDADAGHGPTSSCCCSSPSSTRSRSASRSAATRSRSCGRWCARAAAPSSTARYGRMAPRTRSSRS